MYQEPHFVPAGDQVLLVEMGDDISPETNFRVHNLALAVEERGVPGIVDLVPAYASLLVQYDPIKISITDLQARLSQFQSQLKEQPPTSPRVVEVPTLYGGEYGPDLESVADHAGLTEAGVVSLHSETDYLVYMMGFTPGFPYLGGLPEELFTPRLETPRAKIPAGSVGIAEGQTGVYPVVSPGGWRLIGRTPLKLFDPERDPPSTVSAGDHVRFVPVAGEDEYKSILDLDQSGEYEVESVANR